MLTKGMWKTIYKDRSDRDWNPVDENEKSSAEFLGTHFDDTATKGNLSSYPKK